MNNATGNFTKQSYKLCCANGLQLKLRRKQQQMLSSKVTKGVAKQVARNLENNRYLISQQPQGCDNPIRCFSQISPGTTPRCAGS